MAFDWLKGLFAGGSSILSMGATGTGLTSAFMNPENEEKKVGDTKLSSGVLGIGGRAADLGSAIKEYCEAGNNGNKKWGAGAGALSSLLGIGMGIADIFGGDATASNDKTGQRNAGMASSILGGLGGIATLAQGIFGVRDAGDDKAKKTTGWSSILGGLFSALGGGLSFLGETKDNDGLKKAGSIVGAAGSLGSWISNIAGLFSGNNEQ